MSVEASDEEVDQVGLTSVSLGYAGRPTNPRNALDNHIGGHAVWLNDTLPAKELISCDKCTKEMDLLVQISAPLDNKWYNRVLYVFSCSNTSCRRSNGSIKGIRGIHKTAEIEKSLKAELEAPVSAPNISLGDTLFGSGGGSNPFSGAANPFLSPVADDRLKGPSKLQRESRKEATHKTVSKTGHEPARFKCLDIEVEEEYLTLEDTKLPENVTVDEEPEVGSSEPAEAAAVDPAVNSLLSSVTDPVFAKFIAVIDNNPDQILRYDLPLTPIAYSQDSLYPLLVGTTKLPPGLQFEVQLLPRLISALETPDMLVDGMEWGTILIATPLNDELPDLDANGVGYEATWVGVQWELAQDLGSSMQ